ncbi:MAG: hypothetical protein PF541_15295 [Prolixibacteraceae bacterium]|jgi:hypothetical protein|nr:hypothetical protein [Prolixibacteraceae bacterium]
MNTFKSKNNALLFFCIIIFSFMLSCSKDELYNNKLIEKEWKVITINNVSVYSYSGENEILLKFDKNGVFIVTYNDPDFSESVSGEWFWDEDQLTVLLDGEQAHWSIVKLNSTEFWFNDIEEDALFKCEPFVVYDEIEDGLNGETLGKGYGLTWTSTPNGKGAIFSSTAESRIEYPFSMGLPHEGTIEMQIKVSSGYNYGNYVLNTNQTSAIIFNTGPSDVWFEGAMWFNVDNNGNISLTTALSATPSSHVLLAEKTKFKFDEWHIVSFSYGGEGQYISLDGNIVASNKTYTETLQACGNISVVRVVPSIGEANSVFWTNNRYDQGFEGILDNFRFSKKQQDWILKL